MSIVIVIQDKIIIITWHNFRYKLEIQVSYEGCFANFVMWDQECNDIIGKTIVDLRRVVIEIMV